MRQAGCSQIVPVPRRPSAGRSEYWTGVDADVTVMRKALEKALSL
jgi:hypothetical protein